MLKCQFHTHTAGDLGDNIKFTPKDLIKKAARLGYNVVAITCHRKVIFNKNLKKYAEKKNILLISGIEFEINKKHILGINIDKEIENIKTFDELKKYKTSHPHCLIVAPHPFFPGWVSLKKKLIENIDVFDAIEISFCYTKSKDYNRPAIALAKKWRKPLITTSDCHSIKHLDIAYTLVDSRKDTDSIIKAIKKNKIKLIHSPISYFKIGKILLSRISIRNIIPGKK